MSVKLRPDQLGDLLDRVASCDQEKPQRDYQFEGEIRARIDNILPDYDFIVDRWPDFKAVVARVNKARTRYPAYLGPQVLVYAEDTDALVELLIQSGLVDWSSEFELTSKESALKSILHNAIDVHEAQREALEVGIQRHHDVQFRADPYLVMRVNLQSIKVRTVPEGFKVTSIPPELASLVNSTLTYSVGEGSEVYIQDLLRSHQSCCLYDREGNVVGYALQYHYGYLGMLHVFEQYRGRGYGKVIMSHLAQRCLKDNNVLYVYVSVDNEISISLHLSIGFERLSDVSYILRTNPNLNKNVS